MDARADVENLLLDVEANMDTEVVRIERLEPVAEALLELFDREDAEFVLVLVAIKLRRADERNRPELRLIPK